MQKRIGPLHGTSPAPAQKRAFSLPEAEKAERARAAVVLLLGLYGMTVVPWSLPELGWAWLAMSPAVLGYFLPRRLAHTMYWAAVTCINPFGYGVLQMACAAPPWAALAGPQGCIAAAVFYGLTRLLGFGGRYPMAVGATQVLPGQL